MMPLSVTFLIQMMLIVFESMETLMMDLEELNKEQKGWILRSFELREAVSVWRFGK